MGGNQSADVEGDAAEASARQPRLHGFEEVLSSDPKFHEVAGLIRERSRKYHHKYRNQEMIIRKLWRIPAEDGREATCEELEQSFGEPMPLFHGTDPGSAERISKKGFRLPPHN